MLKPTKENIIAEIRELAKKYEKKANDTNITRNFWRENTQFPEKKIDKLFGGFAALKKAAFAQQRHEVEIGKVSKEIRKRYVVSNITEGSRINEDFLKAVESYAHIKKAEIVLLWGRGVNKKDTFTDTDYARVQPYLATSFKFNSNLAAKDFQLHPTIANPLCGLRRFGSRDTSLIIGSTKQFMESVPRPKGSGFPHVLFSTGTVSLPKFNRTRAGAFSDQDMVPGALIVEVETDRTYHIRPVQYNHKQKGFVDLGNLYTADNVTPVSTEGFVFGDTHFTEEDPVAIKVAVEQANYLNAKRIFLHDIISFNSISHHIVGDMLAQTALPKEFDTLEKDLDYGKQMLNQLDKQLKGDIYVVASNHDDFPRRFASESRYADDPRNAVIGAKFFLKYDEKRNPIEDWVGNKNITFLKPEQSFKVEGYELGQHGNLGEHGSKGNLIQLARTYNKIVVGHSHSPKMYYGGVQVGCTCKLELDYARGASGWLHANCAVYAGGTNQLLVYVGNRWRM